MIVNGRPVNFLPEEEWSVLPPESRARLFAKLTSMGWNLVLDRAGTVWGVFPWPSFPWETRRAYLKAQA